MHLLWKSCGTILPCSLSLSLPLTLPCSQITFTGIEAKTAEGCPTAEWIIRRPSKEELFLALYRHHKGHVCDKIYTVVSGCGIDLQLGWGIWGYEGVKGDRHICGLADGHVSLSFPWAGLYCSVGRNISATSRADIQSPYLHPTPMGHANR